MNTLKFPKYSSTTGHTCLFPKCEFISVHKGKFFKYTTELEIPRSVNGDNTSDNAP